MPYDFKKIVAAAERHTPAHTRLLQLTIQRGLMLKLDFNASYIRLYVSEHSLKEEYVVDKKFTLSNVSEETVDQLTKVLINTVNNNTSMVGLRLVQTQCENTGDHYVCLVSEMPYSSAMAVAAHLSKDQQYLLATWVNEMMLPDSDGAIHINEATKMAKELPNPMPMTKAEGLIDNLVKSQYFFIEHNKITLGTRGLAELAPLLRTKWHTAWCVLCQRPVTRRSTVLSCDLCDSLIHSFCWKKWADTHDTEKARCPLSGCKNEMDKGKMEAAIAELEQLALTGVDKKKKKKRGGDTSDAENGDNDAGTGDILTALPTTQAMVKKAPRRSSVSAPTTSRSRKNSMDDSTASPAKKRRQERKKKVIMESDEDEDMNDKSTVNTEGEEDVQPAVRRGTSRRASAASAMAAMAAVSKKKSKGQDMEEEEESHGGEEEEEEEMQL